VPEAGTWTVGACARTNVTLDDNALSAGGGGAAAAIANAIRPDPCVCRRPRGRILRLNGADRSFIGGFNPGVDSHQTVVILTRTRSARMGLPPCSLSPSPLSCRRAWSLRDVSDGYRMAVHMICVRDLTRLTLVGGKPHHHTPVRPTLLAGAH